MRIVDLSEVFVPVHDLIGVRYRGSGVYAAVGRGDGYYAAFEMDRAGRDTWRYRYSVAGEDWLHAKEAVARRTAGSQPTRRVRVTYRLVNPGKWSSGARMTLEWAVVPGARGHGISSIVRWSVPNLQKYRVGLRRLHWARVYPESYATSPLSEGNGN